MLDEKKQAELDKNLDELERMLYNAVARFAENSKSLVEIPQETCALWAQIFRHQVRYSTEVGMLMPIDFNKEKENNGNAPNKI